MSSDHDPRAVRARGLRTLHGATGTLVAASVLGAGAATLAVIPSGPAAAVASTTAAATTAARSTNGDDGQTPVTTAPSLSFAPPVATSSGS